MHIHISIVLSLLFAFNISHAQDSSGIADAKLIHSFISDVNSRADKINRKLEKYSDKALKKLKKQEDRIRRKLEKKDSLKAVAVFNSMKQQYKQLEQRLQKVSSLQQYIPSLDSVGVSIQFLQQSQKLLNSTAGLDQKLNNALSKVKDLEQQFQKAEEIKSFLKEKKLFLKDQLQNLGFTRELKKLNKRAYYYQAQIAEYKEILKDKKKVEKKVIELLTGTKLFSDFMSKNSFLARLFPQPANPGNLSLQSGFAGLQTRQQVSSFIQQAGLSGPNAISQMQRSIQDAQSQLTELRNKIAQLGGAGGDDLDMPDFKIKSLKTKPFFKRLEYSANFQTQNANRFFPNTGIVGLSIGYRLDERSVVGIGTNYTLGLGSGLNKIRLTHEGIQFISYVDWKIAASKGGGRHHLRQTSGERREGGGNFWISGGYEQVYMARFKKIDELKDLNAWQQNLLLGLSKTVSLKTKFFKNTKFRLLWNCLAFKQVPQTKPLLFRVSYNF